MKKILIGLSLVIALVFTTGFIATRGAQAMPAQASPQPLNWFCDYPNFLGYATNHITPTCPEGTKINWSCVQSCWFTYDLAVQSATDKACKGFQKYVDTCNKNVEGAKEDRKYCLSYAHTLQEVMNCNAEYDKTVGQEVRIVEAAYQAYKAAFIADCEAALANQVICVSTCCEEDR